MIDLNRHFVPLSFDGETIDWGAAPLGRRYGGWLHWDELIAKRRVVLLAEARSGKTEEFRLRASVLRGRGEASFFLRVEDLADGALIDGLTPDEEACFRAWLSGDRPGSFFLDSVDEARLNAKRFESALRRFRRDVGPALDRASVFISCRVSDWKGREDLNLVTSLLPVPTPPSSDEEAPSVDELLLRPISKDRSQSTTNSGADSEAKEPVIIVRLAELATEQRSALARWAGVADSDTFIREIERQGLNTFAERPGDLLELAEYWRVHGRFAGFAEMTRFAVVQKLAERDADRQDADLLTDSRALEGVERVAAALTLAKSLTLRVPGQEPDPTLAAGALDPGDVLPDWTPSERAALLRRGVFTPATYGRVRFHHRSTQEYLTGEWLKRALDRGCPRSEVMSLLFAEPYGIRTAVPSMRPAAAWLAVADPQVRDELLEREPLELIRHGDPRSLPLSVRARLLTVYAERQAAGEVTDDSVDHRSFWMFSDPELAPAIRDAWARNTDPSFRIDLLSLVREGEITGCIDLAREQAFDTAAAPYFRYWGVVTMNACGDREGLVRVAESLMAEPAAHAARDAASLSRHLFPGYLSRSDLIRLIDEVRPAPDATVDGFASYIQDLWERCPRGDRVIFLDELASLCLTPPFRTDYHRVSAKHGRLAPTLAPLAAEVASDLRGGAALTSLIKACAAIERSDESPSGDGLQQIHDALSGWRDFHRELFWFDVLEARRNGERDVTHYWQLEVYGQRIWELTVEDAEWLIARVQHETELQDRRIALSALLHLIDKEMLHAYVDELRASINGVPELESDLAAGLAPPPRDPALDWAERERLAARRTKRREAKVHRSWIEFAAQLRADSGHLRDPLRLSEWANACDLLHLTEWLARRTGNGQADAVRQWPLLREAFGDEVAEAYQAGMKLLWRLTIPRTSRADDLEPGKFLWTDRLSFYGVGLEAEEGEGWAERLTGDEAERAVLHAVSEHAGSPKWIEALAHAHPDRVKPIIADEVATEWSATSGASMDALDGVVHGGDRYFLQMADLVVDRLLERPGRVRAFDSGIRALARLPHTAATRAELIEHAKQELRAAADDDEWALRQIALLFTCSTQAGVEALEWWLAAPAADEERKGRGERAFSVLFSRHRPLLPKPLNGEPIEPLKRLTRLAYRTIRVSEDVHHEGIYRPDRRDEAESARSLILDALLAIPGRATFEALRELAEDPSVGLRRKRFRELAHNRAEKDAEMPAWSAADVLAFERRNAAPAKSGGDLFRIARAIIDDIQTSFLQDDASSRLVLASAVHEEAVQQWLAEQFGLRSNRRFHIHREVEVAGKKEPDILLASTAAPVEVAVEIKHSGKGWTVDELENALRRQLVRDYLRPANRRHGLLVITHHTGRTWKDPDTKAVLDFEQLLARLSRLAETLRSNDTGPVEVAVIGLNAFTNAKH